MGKRHKQDKPKSVFREYFSAIAWALALALIIRAEVVQAFKIPSGSMKPTLLVGDHLLVSKSSYGVKLPFTDVVLAPVGDPERGDVIVFHFPENDKDMIKRIIGLPGDEVEVRGTRVFINGEELEQNWGHYGEGETAFRRDFGPVTVPEGKYFVMGDNRDHSYDSRYWNGGRGGFVDRDNILGRAFFIHWSWKDNTWDVRWNRPGTIIR
jgi:signal peptidase I